MRRTEAEVLVLRLDHGHDRRLDRELLGGPAQEEIAEAREPPLRIDVEIRAGEQADLTAEVSRLALGAAEKVIESNLSEATQQALVESYISQVGAAN